MELLNRSLLSSQRKLSARFGIAPDGLPWLISVDRGAPPESLIVPVAKSLGVSTPPESWQGELKALSDRVRSMLDARQFADLSAEGLAGPHYVTWSSLRQLTGPTVLETLLSNDNRHEVGGTPETHSLNRIDSRCYVDSREYADMADTRSFSDITVNGVLAFDSHARVCMALDLNDENHAVVRTDSRAASQAKFVRNYQFESLYERSTSRFCVRSAGGSVVEGSLSSEYADSRRQISDSTSQWLMTIERNELLRECASLARSLQSDLHDKKYLHGDLKPSNIILNNTGLKYIDSLDIEEGDLAPGLSHTYAAPEQILGRPLDTSADQYSFGVLLNAICGGLLHGEESRFRVPVSSKRIEIFHLLKSPSVFISPLHFRASGGGMKALRMLVERCLSFEPEGRFESMNHLADALDGVLDSFEFEGHLESELRYGTLTHIPEIGYCWLVQDIYPYQS